MHFNEFNNYTIEAVLDTCNCLNCPHATDQLLNIGIEHKTFKSTWVDFVQRATTVSFILPF